MEDPRLVNKQNFLYPRSSYYGKFTAENLIFNANLQDFAQKVGFISNLYTGGKLSGEEAYFQIEALWEQLQYSKQTILGSD
jgi:hypothetical protein